MRISIIGKGNVGTHLFRAFEAADIDVELVDSRTLEGLHTDSEVYMLCVKDDALGEMATRMDRFMADSGRRDAIIVHTAGTKPMKMLEGLPATGHYGVFYPMQTFSKDKTLDYANIPIFLEACDEKTLETLRSLASKAFKNVRELSSEQRKTLHIAAVFCSNFTNHMVTLADRELQTIGLDYSVMLPLLDEVVSKLHQFHPIKAQTGPAVRGDLTVVSEHISRIKDEETRLIYKSVSHSINDKL